MLALVRQRRLDRDLEPCGGPEPTMLRLEDFVLVLFLLQSGLGGLLGPLGPVSVDLGSGFARFHRHRDFMVLDF